MVTELRPSTLAPALAQLNAEPTLIFAGGTDLMVHELKPHNAILFVDAIEELQQIEVYENSIRIGAGCRLAQLVEHTALPRNLVQALHQIAAPALRNVATIGGNIVNASPAADSLPALTLLDAKVCLQNVNGERWLPIDEFIIGPGKTILQPGEMLTQVEIARIPCHHSMYHKVGTRAANALSKLSVAALARFDDSGALEDWRIAFGAVAPTVVRNRDIELSLIGCKPEEVDMEQLLGSYDALLHPIDDQRSTAEYRRRASLNLLKHWMEQLQQ
ncbi:FAD binding domain-containing protein [Ferrimonas aestuarii]|uniref:Xanthine dehydrogenase family protein subunit M n=1 Tax=Ferrimonas aestuarii TaxID=2569539 RepID=A0A4U1BJU4_9GAMM|nr:xanthine dehydrogenase family protein subunit M [Ferrimonas aestuarii]TKB51858.1 xanthine dehydrogenase family protein subunit M [Ferrimonas aestuarii]